MHLVLPSILIVLLATCPIVCGTADACVCVQGEVGVAHGTPGQSGLPAPANDDDCLCNGALKAGEGVSDLSRDAHSRPSSHVPAGFDLAMAPNAPVDASFHRGQLRSGDAAGGARSSILRC